MKTLSLVALVALSLSFSYNASAITFSVVGPCSHESLYSGSFKTDLDESVGATTIEIFNAYNIPFKGSISGMSSIMDTPVGDAAIEVLSDTKMRAYGWCFSINGMIPDLLSSEIQFTKQNDHLSWFFAYSTYDQGVWTDYCVPSYRIKAAQFCKNP